MKSATAKKSLKEDTVDSDTFHIGIELELCVNGGDGESYGESHDDEACRDSHMENLGDEAYILCHHLNLTLDQASAVECYFDRERWVEDYRDSWRCVDHNCAHKSNSGEDARAQIRERLVALTGNSSFKVIEDGSITKDSHQTDAEVCWNYFASKETVKDNTKILAFLKNEGMTFNTSCGLHINLNNYLNVPNVVIKATDLDFLFDFVGASRRNSRFCSRFGMNSEKYSMIHNQGGRLEFRFFSPTLEASKLNHYVTLANTVYKRLAGKESKLPKRTAQYFVEKMVKVNGLTQARAELSIARVNGILAATSYAIQEVSTLAVEAGAA